MGRLEVPEWNLKCKWKRIKITICDLEITFRDFKVCPSRIPAV
jgi:hypothetical protein